MSEPINLLVVDLSHYDPAQDYGKVKESGIAGIIYKATEGTGYQDQTYFGQMAAAKDAGLLWGAYHFANGSNLVEQAQNFCDFTQLDENDLFVLDWEDGGEGGTMTNDAATGWVEEVESFLGRPGDCVLYSGNVAKEQIKGYNAFWAQRRLWLAQYSTTPSVQQSWAETGYFLWQYTDKGSVPGISGEVDLNSFKGTPAQLRQIWAHGRLPAPVPPPYHAQVSCPHCKTKFRVTLEELPGP